MLLKCSILGLVLLLIGGLAYAWVYNETHNEQEQDQNSGLKYSLGPEEYLDKYGRWYRLTPEQQNQLALEVEQDRRGKTKEQLAREQQARLRADLDKLAAHQMNPGDIADFLYGSGWEDEVEQYKQRQEKMGIAQTVATVCLWIGGIVVGVCAAIGVLWGVVRVVKVLRRRSRRRTDESEPKVSELTDIEQDGPVEDLEAPTERPKQRRRILALSETTADSQSSSVLEEPGTVNDFLTATFSRHNEAGYGSLAAPVGAEESAVDLLLTDEKLGERGWSPEMQWGLHSGPAVSCERDSQTATVVEEPPTMEKRYEETVSIVDDPLQEQADGLQKQIAEFKQMAQDVQQTARDQSEPLTSTLRELAQQVSAIRDYAASQQGRVEKLQDGYDWGIIRTFCLKVIRCLDNLENRIGDLPDDDGAVTHLEEVRDELFFALESSGIEQYHPEINSDYRGQEKLAEAIKDKEPAKNPDEAGKIAKVLRPGYRYMIDDENFKVVRTAQVKLFG